jgi:uncharacterized protein
VLLRLARIYGEDDLEQRAVSTLALLADWLSAAPSAFGYALSTVDFLLGPRREIAVVGDATAPVVRAVRARFDPYAAIAFGPSERVALLRGKGLLRGQAAVYVCENFACSAPLADTRQLARALDGAAA